MIAQVAAKEDTIKKKPEDRTEQTPGHKNHQV